MAKNENRDGLSDDDFARAEFMARFLWKRGRISDFIADCQQLARRRLLTRKQLAALDRAFLAVKNQSRPS